VKVTATNSAGCSITDNKDIAVTVSLTPPTGVTATAQTSASVLVAWTLPAGTPPDLYNVYRSANGVTYSLVGSVAHPAVQHLDGTASANTAYLYKVRSANEGDANESADSNRDLATTVIFTDGSLAAAQVKAIHVAELRIAVNAVRALATLGAGTYTGPLLVAQTTTIKRAHVVDLRSALDAARSALALAALSYGESLTVAVTPVKASHVTELRAGVQ
jgi:hypothetical protein